MQSSRFPGSRAPSICSGISSRQFFGWLAAFLFCLAASSPKATAAPANDLCSGAVTIPASGPFPYLTPVVDIGTATTNGDPAVASSYLPNLSRSVWYKFTPQVSGVYDITTCSTEGTATTVPDTAMGIYTTANGACGGPYTLRGAFGDEECGSQAELTLDMKAGTNYYIVVWKYNDGCSSGCPYALQLKISLPSLVANDTCASPIPVTLNLPVEGTTVNAMDDYQLAAPDCFTGIGQVASTASGRDVVYSFTATNDGTYSVKVRGYSVVQNLVLYATTTCPPSGGTFTANECVAAANRNGVSSSEQLICMPLTNGQTIYLFVDDNTTDGGSAFVLEVNRCRREVEPNDSPTSAGPLPGGVEGTIGLPGDVDYYALGIFPAEWRVFAALDGESANGTDFDLRVTTLTNTLEFDHNDNDSTFGDSSPNIAGTLLTGGPAFIQVSYNGPQVSEPYRLYSVVQPPLAVAAPETEPNDTPAQAGSDARNYFHGTLSGPAPSTDVDCFSFNANPGDLIFLSLDADPTRMNSPINARLELIGPSGNVVLAINDDKSVSNTNQTTNVLGAFTPNSPAEAILFRCWTGGVYYARVSIGTSSAGIVGAGDYLLSISRNGSIGAPGTNHPPIFTNLAVNPVIEENGTATLSGTLVDLDAGDPQQLTIIWGDGTTNQWSLVAGGVVPLNFTHQYLDDNPSGTSEDTRAVTLRITDSRGATFSIDTSLIISNVPPSPAALTPVPAMIAEGSLFTLNGVFVEPGTADSHEVIIQWGDATDDTVLNLGAGLAHFSANHIFNNDVPVGTPADPYLITVIVADDDGGRSTNTTLITVSNVPPSSINLGLSANLIGENDSVQLNGTFTDPGIMDSYQVVINWGDGTLNVTQHLAAGTFAFSAGHQYLDDNPSGTPNDFYNITVTITDSDLGIGQGGIFVTVTNRPPMLTGIGVTTPVVVSNSAMLTGQIVDTGTLDTFTLTVNWGDGSTPQQFNYPAGTSFFSESHLYTAVKSNVVVSLLLADDDTGFASASVNLQVRSATGPALFTEVVPQPGGSVLLRGEGTPQGIYRLESSATLAPDSWTFLGNRTADATGRFEYEDAAPLPAHRFYRARVAE